VLLRCLPAWCSTLSQLDWYGGGGKADGDAKKASAPFFEWLENADAEMDEAD
jgi:hypothetical protein